MEEMEFKPNLEKMVFLAMDCLEVGVTILDSQGTLLYYNSSAAKILDRQPEYVGKDIHLHHKPGTNEKFDFMLHEFAEGRAEPFYYEAKPYGQAILITVAPIRNAGKFVGCAHCVRLKEAPVKPD